MTPYKKSRAMRSFLPFLEQAEKNFGPLLRLAPMFHWVAASPGGKRGPFMQNEREKSGGFEKTPATGSFF